MKRDPFKLLLITGSALILAACFDILFYRKVPGISFPIFTGLLLATTFLLARRFKVTIDSEAITLAALAFMLSLMVFIRSSTVLVTLDIVISLYLFVLLLGRFAGLSLREFLIVNYLRQLFGASLQSLKEWFWVLRELIDSRETFHSNKALRQISRGIMITLPVLTVFILLLSSADLVLNKYLADLVHILKRLKFIEHIAIVTIASTTLIGMLAYAFYRRSGQKQGEDIEVAFAGKVLSLGFFKSFLLLCAINFFSLIASLIITEILYFSGYFPYIPFSYSPLLNLSIPIAFTAIFIYIFYRYRLQHPGKTHAIAVASRVRSFSFIESAILLSSLNALFLVFIFLQFMYLFGGDSNIAPQGFTYAEYAHRGFFELISVALLSFLVIWLIDSKIDRGDIHRLQQFKALAGSLIGLVVLIMVSAFKRLLIYEAAYGYTILRVYTQVFIVMLGIIFLLLLYKLIVNRHESWFALRSFCVAITFLIGLNIVNVDQVIARLNIERFKVTHNEDLLIYNMKLSEDAIDQVIDVYYRLDPSDSEDWISNQLKNRLNYLEKVPWQSYSLSRDKALKKLRLWEVDFNGENRQEK